VKEPRGVDSIEEGVALGEAPVKLGREGGVTKTGGGRGEGGSRMIEVASTPSRGGEEGPGADRGGIRNMRKACSARIFLIFHSTIWGPDEVD